MERQPFNLIEERERSSREYREHRARLRELTVEPEKKEPTLREEMTQRMERAEAVLSELHPGSPGAVATVCSCLLDVVDVLTYVLDRDNAETHK